MPVETPFKMVEGEGRRMMVNLTMGASQPGNVKLPLLTGRATGTPMTNVTASDVDAGIRVQVHTCWMFGIHGVLEPHRPRLEAMFLSTVLVKRYETIESLLDEVVLFELVGQVAAS